MAADSQNNKQQPSNLPGFKLLASGTLELAVPIKFQNLHDSCSRPQVGGSKGPKP